MLFKLITGTSILLTGAFFSSLAFAKVNTEYGTFSVTLQAASEYRYRGISKSGDEPYAQANLDWKKNGFYAGISGATLDFSNSEKGHYENITYGGYKYTAPNAKFSLDGGISYYLYPFEKPSEHYEYGEVKLIADYNWGFMDTKLGLYHSPNYYDNSGASNYAATNIAVPIGDTGFFLLGSLGHLWVNDNTKIPNYSDWALGASYHWEEMRFELKYVDSSIRNTKCPYEPHACAATAIFSIARMF
ncbi:MAG: TorF family putative porin [Pseudomonadota bacterium]|nr:TorF family putative porin [Pseudomonadota bacterium]